MSEKIGDNEILYRRFSKHLISNSETPSENIFEFRKDEKTQKYEEDLSVNWKKYCLTAEEAKNKAKNKPHNKGIVSLISGDIVNFCNSNLINSPSGWVIKDKSHSSIIPIKGRSYIMDEKQRYLIYRQTLARYSKWEIK